MYDDGDVDVGNFENGSRTGQAVIYKADGSVRIIN